MNDPFFIIGAPRSGTTFLAQVLSRHPKIFITDETRVLTHVSRFLNELPADPRVLLRDKDEWLNHARKEMRGVVTRFYRSLGAPEDGRWGDKNPHYADSWYDPVTLDTIDRMYRRSQFLHIVRDGRAVVASLLSLGWATNLDYAIDVWRRHVDASREFGARIDPKRYHEFRFEDLVADADTVIAETLGFLGLDPAPEVIAYLRAQERERTPISGPTSPLDQLGKQPWRDTLTTEQIEAIDGEVGDLLVHFRYEEQARVDALGARGAPPLPYRTETDAIVERARGLVADGSTHPAQLRETLAALLERYDAAQGDIRVLRRRGQQLTGAMDHERRRGDRFEAQRKAAVDRYSRLVSRFPLRQLVALRRYTRSRSSR